MSSMVHTRIVIRADWPRVPGEPTAAALKKDIALLVAEHGLLRAAMAVFPPAPIP